MTNSPSDNETNSPFHSDSDDAVVSDVNGRADDCDLSAGTEKDDSEEILIRKRKKRIGLHKKKVRRRILISLALVVALIAAGVATVAYLMRSGEHSARNASAATEIEVPENAVGRDAGKEVVYNGETYRLNENIVSVCVIGFDREQVEVDSTGRNGQADAIMVLTIDTKTGKASAISIPRDSMLDVGEWAGDLFMGQDQMQACLAFSYGTDAQSGAQLTTTVASHLLYGMPIGHYFAMDMECVGALADSVGGVPLTPLQSIPGTSIVEGEPTVLFGSNALKYVRYRDLNNFEGSTDRQARQTQFVKAFASQLTELSAGSVGVISDLYTTASQYSVTDVGSDEFVYLTSLFLKYGVSSFEVNPLVIERSEIVDGHIAYYLDQTSVYEAVLDSYYIKVEG